MTAKNRVIVDDLDQQLAEVRARNSAREAADRQAEDDQEEEHQLRAQVDAREQARAREAGLGRIATMLRAYYDGNGRLATEIEDFYALILQGLSDPVQAWISLAADFGAIERELQEIGCPLRDHTLEAGKAFESVVQELERRGVDCWALHGARNSLRGAPFQELPNLTDRPHGNAVGDLIHWEIHRRAVQSAAE